jgi:hypothetical protein
MADSEDTITPPQMREWLTDELRGLNKAVELRTKDATDFVTAYERGELTEEQMTARLDRYQSRWGDSPIRGVMVTDKMTDEEVLARLDKRWLKTVEDSRTKLSPNYSTF